MSNLVDSIKSLRSTIAALRASMEYEEEGSLRWNKMNTRLEGLLSDLGLLQMELDDRLLGEGE